MSRLRNITAIVLKKRDFMENDLSLSLIDDSGQRIEVIVKGAGSQKSRRRRHLERMNLIKGSLYEGKNNLYLQDVECQSSFSQMKDDLDKIMQASILMELTERCVMVNDPHPEIYQLIFQAFEMLNKKDVQPHLLEMCLVQFANHLGFLPNFRECSQCHQEKLESALHWNRIQGTLHCEDCDPNHEPLALKYRKAIQFFKQTNLSSEHQIRIEKDEHIELRELIYELLQAHLHSPLKSLSLSY